MRARNTTYYLLQDVPKNTRHIPNSVIYVLKELVVHLKWFKIIYNATVKGFNSIQKASYYFFHVFACMYMYVSISDTISYYFQAMNGA